MRHLKSRKRSLFEESRPNGCVVRDGDTFSEDHGTIAADERMTVRAGQAAQKKSWQI